MKSDPTILKKIAAVCFAAFFMNTFVFSRNMEVECVDVAINNICDEQISKQISGIAKTMLARKGFCGDYRIKINLSQRSFYKNIDTVNSIYVHYELWNSEGKRLFENVFLTEGKETILSTAMQNRQVEKIVRDLARYFRTKESESNA